MGKTFKRVLACFAAVAVAMSFAPAMYAAQQSDVNAPSSAAIAVSDAPSGAPQSAANTGEGEGGAPISGSSSAAPGAGGQTQPPPAGTSQPGAQSGGSSAPVPGGTAGSSMPGSEAPGHAPAARAADGASPFAGELVARLVGSVGVNNTNPYSGEAFELRLQVNSITTGGETNEGVQNCTASFALPANIEVVAYPHSSLYTITPASGANGNTVTVRYNVEVPVGTLHVLKFDLRFKAGISYPGGEENKLDPTVQLAADNAEPATAELAEPVVPQNKAVPPILATETEPTEPTFLHTSTVKLQREDYIGGLNHTGSKVTIAFPPETEVFAVRYGGNTYPAVENSTGEKVATVPLNTFNVTSYPGAQEWQEVVLLYSYPPLTVPGTTKDYTIKVAYDAVRYGIDADVHEEANIYETARYMDGVGDASAYFQKSASSTLRKTPGAAISFELNVYPQVDMKGVALTDDPVRGGEADFLAAVQYSQVLWQAYSSNMPGVTGKVRTEVLYETSGAPGSWFSAGSPLSNGSVHMADLGLAADETVTRLQFRFYGADGSDVVPAGSGQVKIRIFGEATADIGNITGTSYEDNTLTNSAYLTGAMKLSNQTTYAAIADDGTANMQRSNTSLVASVPRVGFAGWEAPFSVEGVNIGDAPVEIGNTVLYMVHLGAFDENLADPLIYIPVRSPYFEITDVVLPANLPNAEYSIADGGGSGKTIVLKPNEPLVKTEHFYPYQIGVRGKVLPGVDNSVGFGVYVGSSNTNEALSFGYWENWSKLPGVNSAWICGNTITQSWLRINRDVALTQQTLASLDNADFRQTVSGAVPDLGGTDGYYSMKVHNAGTSTLDEVHLIDMLPKAGDTLTISGVQKKSTITPIVQGITQKDGSPVPASVQLFYSTDATNESNKAELEDFAAVGATWIPWDGTSSPTGDDSVRAIKIVSTASLAAGEELEFVLKVRLPQSTEDIDSAWNSVSAGAQLGTSYALPGEPYKSGIYISNRMADKELAGVLWEDKNGNHLRDAGERALPNVVVRLYDWDESLAQETTTDGSGHYEFTGLYDARYRVEFDLPQTYSLATPRQGTDTTIDSDFLPYIQNEALASAPVDLRTEPSPENIDAGLYRTAVIGDYVWEDINDNGLQDSFEQGVRGVAVHLYRVENGGETHVATTRTGAGGSYFFRGMAPGEYRVKVDEREGYRPCKVLQTFAATAGNSKLQNNWETDPFTLESGASRLDIDLGITTFAQTGSVLLVKQNENGEALPGATFGIWASTADPATDAPLKTATSSGTGLVLFDEMLPGSYIVKETAAPGGYVLSDAEHTATVAVGALVADLGVVVNVRAIPAGSSSGPGVSTPGGTSSPPVSGSGAGSNTPPASGSVLNGASTTSGPATGDGINILMWFGLCLLGLLGFAAATVILRGGKKRPGR